MVETVCNQHSVVREYQQAMPRFVARRFADKSHCRGRVSAEVLGFGPVSTAKDPRLYSFPLTKRRPGVNTKNEFLNKQVLKTKTNSSSTSANLDFCRCAGRPIAPSINISIPPNTLVEPFCIFGVLSCHADLLYAQAQDLNEAILLEYEAVLAPNELSNSRSSVRLASACLGC